MRLAWPRFRQLFVIIVSSVSDVLETTFPDRFVNVNNAFSKVVNLEVLDLPGMACLVGESDFLHFAASMLVPLILVGLVKTVSILHVRHIRARLTIAEDTRATRSYKLKLHRAIVVSRVSAHYTALMFAIVYLLYPGTCRKLFEIFRCRSVGHPSEPTASLLLLEADYTIECLTGMHLPFTVLGAVWILLYSRDTLMVPK
jgi:hypothetical protein